MAIDRTQEEEVIGIHFVEFAGSDLGTPAPNTVFDTAAPPASHGALVRWAGALLRARPRSPEGLHPILPVEIRGQGKATMVRRLSKSLPDGVEVYTHGAGRFFRSTIPRVCRQRGQCSFSLRGSVMERVSSSHLSSWSCFCRFSCYVKGVPNLRRGS